MNDASAGSLTDEGTTPARTKAEAAELSVLVVDDDAGFSQAISKLISALGCAVQCAATLDEARACLHERCFDHVLLDLMMPDGSGLELLGLIDERSDGDSKVTIVTGDPAVKQMIRRMYGPGVNYLLKPVDLDDIRRVLGSAGGGDRPADHFQGLIGDSEQMQALRATIERVGRSSANVIILGESGVGKELVAEAIHAVSKVTGSFVPANCGAFNRELVGSELFGHEKGAFTGAHSRRKGLFEQAAGGTLFLDEITEMPQELQPNLLRVLETKSCTRLGGTVPIPVDCRVVSATNRTEKEIGRGDLLREDVLFRLAVYPITVPPLRERKEDIAQLTRYFLEHFSREYGVQLTCSDAVLQRLEEYDWPGNVRELRHTIHRAVILSEHGEDLDLPERLGSPFTSENQEDDSLVLRPGQSIESVERTLIELTLEQYGNNKKRAAEALGVSLKTLYNRINAYAQEAAAPGSADEGIAGKLDEAG